MKVVLIVASGVHQGKKIPVVGSKFLIGRDPQCQLRPASQAISKQHCGILLRDGKVFVVDYGSTNGTLINGERLTPNQERELRDGDQLKAGPLDFTISLAAGSSTGTPIPSSFKAGGSGSTERLPAAKPTPAKSKSDSEDDIAAILLSADESDPAPAGSGSYRVPDGSTMMEIPTGAMQPPAAGGQPADSKKDAKEDSSSAASELLRKYMRRPR